MAALAVVRLAPGRLHLIGDRLDGGPQRFHVRVTPRVGGVAIFFGALAGGLLFADSGFMKGREVTLVLLASIPIFCAGLAEDLSKRVSARDRLFMSFAAAAIGFLFLEAQLRSLHLPFLDPLLGLTPFAFVLTLVAVGGVAHAFNIIDGYNGLAAMVGIIVFAALGFVGYQVGDTFVLGICLTMAGALAGFLVWNFPRGALFAGDSGAYLLGFMVAETSVLLVARNQEVSPWFPMLLSVYPVWETLFSIYRKWGLRGRSPNMPDGLHLHMLIYKRLVRFRIGSKLPEDKVWRNSLTSPYLWALSSLTAIPAVVFWDSTPLLMLSCGLFAVTYCTLYRAIVHFRVPKWLVLRVRVKPGIAPTKERG